MSSSNDQVVIPMLQRHTNDLPEMIARDQETITQGAVLSFHNICYRVQVKSGSLLQRRMVEKEILSNISGIMKPGLNAIMGPSGGGKSVLLDVLAARKDPRGLSGEVLVNGAPRPANFPHHSGYVAQSNPVMDTLMVRENLQFSAALQLPTMTNNERKEQVNKVIQELGLRTVADSKIICCGARKRTCIAMELISDPSILFLDEPTTGLYSSIAISVLSFLKSISKQGRTIIFTIHQPRYSIFKLFDSLTLLASGKLMYHGPAQEALEYFKLAGYQCEPYNNPGYFFVDVLKRDFSAVVLNRKEEDSEANGVKQISKREKPVVDTLAEFYTNSSFYRNTKAILQELSDGQKRSSGFKEITHVTSFCYQFRWILWRASKNLLGFPRVTIPQMFAKFILGLVGGTTFLMLKDDCTEVQNRAWALYVLIVFQCFSSVTAGEIFELQKKLFKTTSSVPDLHAGVKRIASSVISRDDLLDYVGFKMKVKILEEFNSVLLGISVNFGTMTPWLSWLEYLSIPHYGYTALQHNEFLGQNFCPELNATEISGCASYVMPSPNLKEANSCASSWKLQE
ncbi:broad substrate specificity ATP-binding cassette transporter ABCG2-like [Urocitellus parryii]